MVPRMRNRKRRGHASPGAQQHQRQQHALQQDEDEQLQVLISEMEEHMSLDRILEARQVVNRIQSIPDAPITPKQREEMDHILQESNHVLELMDDLQNNDHGWILCRSRKGVTVHYRNEKGDPIHAVKTRCILDNCGPTDFVHLCSLFAETDLFPGWFPQNILDSCESLAEPSKYRHVLRMVLNFGRLSPIANREMIAEGIGYHLKRDNAFLVLTKSIDDSPFCDIPPVPPRMVRMESRTAFLLKLLPGRRVEFCQISHDDLKFKYVPAFVTNYLSQGTIPFELIQSLKHVMSTYEGSEWDKRVKKRRDFYQEIEERVHEEMAVINATKPENGESEHITLAPSHGLPLWKAVCLTSTLVAFTRWSLDWLTISVPGLACVARILMFDAILTYCAFQNQYRFRNGC